MTTPPPRFLQGTTTIAPVPGATAAPGQNSAPTTAFPDVADVLMNLVNAGFRPAVLAGDWFGVDAVIAPHTESHAVDHSALFATDTATDIAATNRWFFGVRPYDGRSFGAVTNSVLVLCDGAWHAINVPADVQRIAGFGCGATAALPTPAIAWNAGNQVAHAHGVERCKEAIRAGEVYQACISTRFTGHVEVSQDSISPEQPTNHELSFLTAASWFAAKVREYSPARAAFLPGNPSESTPTVASLSPEEFLIRDGDTVTETPIKGTLPLSAQPEDLLASEKDVAENIMIVDLVRHDLGQIAVTGGVRVTDLLSVRPAPGVWHLFSTVAATIPESLPHAEVVEACFPPASVTGTPKLRAQELIGGWEPVSRGVHCGCIGASVGKAMELNVAIRTVEFFEGPTSGTVRAELGVGGGITIDSDATAEWDEVNAKAAPLL